ncbi:MAG: PRTRC system protein E [Methylicorpusculum sp.]|uniref:PRTRC system protein E n=1 Tax=Methylicorpusculum sp. TaxID=2713644 RepID=UPI002720895C|nr:PRTRC system protein E [Methylicorpusculum sp.]MDO9241683.1 PRTRC system protein E [Methylicorpusculum sp.]MDP2180742.1 PRTRC system protein E [Methylicorpusculum sp.]
MIFETFQNMLKNDERIQFTVTRKGEQLAVLVQPVLQGGLDEKASEAIQSLRAALAMPLYVVTNPQALDADFPRSLADYAEMREDGHNDLKDVMSRIKEAGKQAKTEAAKNNQPDKPAEKSRFEEASHQDETNEKSAEIAVTDKSLF